MEAESTLEVRESNKLTKNEKQALGLLSIGTFLEYFDLMLYVHMAVVLNEVFFPKTDPYIKSLITASAFCSTYIMRPFGAILFGWVGDNLGRKVTLIITTMLMSISCIVMSILPTYAQVGITASILVTLCRIIQGMSSMGEIVGAQLYLTEFIRVPARYPAVATIAMAASIGAFGALGVASLVLSNENLSWRYAFLVGAFIATIGWTARNSLRETPEFIDAKKRRENILQKANLKEIQQIKLLETVSKKTVLSLFFLDCMWPICFYFTYIYCAEILQNSFHYSNKEVIYNNLIVSVFQIFMDLSFIIISTRIHPLKILQIKVLIVGFLFAIFPYWVKHASSGYYIMLFQCLVVFFAPDAHNGVSTIYNHFHTLKRFTYTSFIYALSRAIVYAMTAFGFIVIFKYLGNVGVSLFVLIMACLYLWGRQHFVSLEKSIGHSYPLVSERKGRFSRI